MFRCLVVFICLFTLSSSFLGPLNGAFSRLGAAEGSANKDSAAGDTSDSEEAAGEVSKELEKLAKKEAILKPLWTLPVAALSRGHDVVPPLDSDALDFVFVSSLQRPPDA